MESKPKILAFAGSLREASYNKKVLKIAAKGAENAGAEVSIIELNDFPLPIYNPDEHERNGDNEFALKLQRLLRASDGFLISSPEYNGSVSGALKNAIDWASRPNDEFPREEIFREKFGAIMTAGPGSFGGLRTLAHLRGILTSVGVNVLAKEIAVPFVNEKLNESDGQMMDEKTKINLEGLGESLVKSLKNRN